MKESAPSSTTDDWNQHWSCYARSNALNPAQAYRRKLIFEALALPPSESDGPRLLEIGCGQGEFSSELAQRYPEAQLVGLDLSHTGVSIARSRVPSGAFFQQDLLQPRTLPDKYHAWATHAVCSEVLEHLDDPLSALRNVRTCLGPGARLVITVPAGPMSAFDKHIGHRSHFTPKRLRRLLIDAGLQVESLHGAGFPFFNLYRLTVVARGQKLIGDAGRELPYSARAAIWVYDKLFRLNSSKTLRGWQLIAVAIEPGRSSARS